MARPCYALRSTWERLRAHEGWWHAPSPHCRAHVDVTRGGDCGCPIRTLWAGVPITERRSRGTAMPDDGEHDGRSATPGIHWDRQHGPPHGAPPARGRLQDDGPRCST